MQSLEYIHLIWDYNYWAHHKLMDNIMTISHDDFVREIDYGLGSLHRHMVHVMWTEALWLRRIQGQERINWTIEDYPTRENVIQQWASVEKDYRSYLDSLTIEELNREIPVYSQSADKTYPHYVKDILIHVVNHGTDHRAQMLRLIGDYGGQTFEQDIIFYLREKQSSE